MVPQATSSRVSGSGWRIRRTSCGPSPCAKCFSSPARRDFWGMTSFATRKQNQESISADACRGRGLLRRSDASHDVAWLASDRRHPGEAAMPGLACVVFDEDRTRNRKDHSAENLAVIRKLALNVLKRAHGIDNHPSPPVESAT